MTASEIIQQAIDESIRRNRIVTIEEYTRGPAFDELLRELSAVAQDSTSYYGPGEEEYTYEYWGIRDGVDTDEWRIHLVTIRS